MTVVSVEVLESIRQAVRVGIIDTPRLSRNHAVTEIVKIPNRGHSLTIDHGWREVAQPALDFVKRFA